MFLKTLKENLENSKLMIRNAFTLEVNHIGDKCLLEELC